MAKHKTVQDVMTPDPITLPLSAPLIDAAKTMRDVGIGDVVVVDGDEVLGIVTDRDIVVRGIADGRDPQSTTPRLTTRSARRCASCGRTRSAACRSWRAGVPWASSRSATWRSSRTAARRWLT